MAMAQNLLQRREDAQQPGKGPQLGKLPQSSGREPSRPACREGAWGLGHSMPFLSGQLSLLEWTGRRDGAKAPANGP